MKLQGWGRFPVRETELVAPRDIESLRQLVQTRPGLIARGNGRAYGDSALGQTTTLSTRHLNKLIAFDPATGQLIAEAGALLGDIIHAFLPRGWFPMVTPGSKYVTLGGMIAADVHGKNHHKDGSFRSCVDWIEVMDGDGQIRRASRDREAELFEHTLGGMGLTGVVLRAAIRLRPVPSGWIRQTTYPANNLQEAMAAFERHADAHYSVAWIDCLSQGANLGRSLIMLGEHAELEDLPRPRRARPYETPARRKLSLPVTPPAFALNRMSVAAFNALYFRAGRAKPGPRLVDWDSYFYPLDAILGWNRIYGRRGFAQYQCVLPVAEAEAGLRAILRETAKTGSGSFLSVLKRFGPQDSAFSFPMDGYTLAMDFPVNPRSLSLMTRLDRIVTEHQGRFYLAKDSRMTAETLRASDPRVSAFTAMRQSHGHRAHFKSAQAERLSL